MIRRSFSHYTKRNEVRMPHVKISSNGLPTGTYVTVNGEVIDTVAVSFRVGMHGRAIATIDVYVDEIEIDGSFEVCEFRTRRPK